MDSASLRSLTPLLDGIDRWVELAPLLPVIVSLELILSADNVENCKIYKPTKEVYQLALDAFSEEKDKYTFFSSNCWDIHGASIFGLKTVWVNRINKIDENLPGKPDFIINKLIDHKINKI